jgi:hypothetical protein
MTDPTQGPRTRAAAHSGGVAYRPVGRTSGSTESARLVLDESEQWALDGALLRHVSGAL